MTTPLPPELVAEILGLGTSTIYESSNCDCFLPAILRPVWRGAAVVGRALPVSTAAGDNLPLHAALEHAAPGDVLVVDGQGEPCGYWGEVLAVAALERGVVGLVIDGGVRDVDRLEALQFPVFSSHVAMRGTAKRDAGAVGTPVRLGHTVVGRGDMVVADADGVLALPVDRVADVLGAARTRQAAEAGYLDRLRAGELTLDIYGLRSLLSATPD